MRVRATATKSGFVAGQEYDLQNDEAQAMIIAGNAEPVTVAPAHDREKVTRGQYDKR